MSLPEEIQQWVTGQDGIKNLTREAVKLSKPGDGEVLVKINAISLNYRDTEGTSSVGLIESTHSWHHFNTG